MDPHQQYQPQQMPQQYPQYQPQPVRPQTKGQVAVERAKMSRDNGVLAATIILLTLASSGYFVFSILKGMSTDDLGRKVNMGAVDVAIGIVIALVVLAITFGVILGLGMFMVRMMRQKMLGNSLQVEYSSFAWLRDWANEVSADLEMPRVEIFITQDPVINAYAFGFARPYTIVLHSGSIRYLTKDEIKAIVVHEMAHIKYHHTDANVYLSPFLSIPVISAAGVWITGFWRRRAELTADRLALMYLGDSELVKSALIKTHIGPDNAKDMNDVARQWLQYNAERPMNRLAQTFSTHPFLVRRLSHIDRWKSVVEPEAMAAGPVNTTPAVPVAAPATAPSATPELTAEPAPQKKSSKTSKTK